MKNIKTILVDDEANNLAYLHSLILENCKMLNIIEMAANANDGLLMIQELQPQLKLFL
jgi:YesN/AraC family two-component response regulator